MLKNQKGITLIALIITIIVMLILVGVTINVALNGGLFSKAEEATTKTKIAQVKEALAIKKAEIVADNNGVEPEYTLTISDLNLPTELETEYGSKLKISKDGNLGYDASVVTNKEEQDIFKSMGIEEYVETVTGDSYTFTLAEFVAKEGVEGDDDVFTIPFDNFWPENVSEDLKNSTIERTFGDHSEVYITYNITCSNSSFTNGFDYEEWSGDANTFMFAKQDQYIAFMIVDENEESINTENYTNYADLTFTISMAE